MVKLNEAYRLNREGSFSTNIHASASSVTATVLLMIVLTSSVFNGTSSLLPTLADPATFWNHLTTSLGLGAKLDPPKMARAYALVHVAIYDSILASSARDGRDPSMTAVAAGAASEVLTYLFPGNATLIVEQEAAQSSIVQSRNRGLAISSLRFGHVVGRMVVQHGEHDGSGDVFIGTIPKGACVWTGVNPVEPMTGHWETWIITSSAEFQPEAPYPCGSQADLLDVQSVLDASLARTSEQIAVVHKWADVSPPVIWNMLLNDRVAKTGMFGLESARAYAYLNIAMYDSFVSCWFTKYTFWTARPFQRIPGLTTVVRTPNFPSYTSGHSTISAAASMVMGELFPDGASFFDGQAREAAMSRLWAGIHFPHDNQQGLIVGGEVGAKVVRDMRGDAHTFVFPMNMEAIKR